MTLYIAVFILCASKKHTIGIMTFDQTVKNAEDELIKLDPQLGELIKRQRPVIHHPRTDYFVSLTRSIVGQQVSVAAALSMFNRLNDVSGLKPARVALMTDEELRSCGLSRQKAGYIKDLAQHFVNQPGIYSHFENQSDEQIIKELTEVKGIGEWTAQMFLMFTLSRPDVFAPDDIGLQRAMKQLYGWETVPARQELLKLTEKWKPYRTIASWHLWESLHNNPL
jgi:DNA-3-methyladenine glycosylase II